MISGAPAYAESHEKTKAFIAIPRIAIVVIASIVK
jgi:hypothetical protein